MKAQKKTDRRSTRAMAALTGANGRRQNASIENNVSDEIDDEFDAPFAHQLFVDGAGLDDTDNYVSDWCEAQELARELANRVLH